MWFSLFFTAMLVTYHLHILIAEHQAYNRLSRAYFQFNYLHEYNTKFFWLEQFIYLILVYAYGYINYWQAT